MNRQFPIGEFQFRGPLSAEERAGCIQRIESLPERLRAVVATLTDVQLNTPYRNGGWTARQVVHHLADSHMHSFLRFKYALAINGSPVLAYPEAAWAGLADNSEAPVALALDLLEALHRKWVFLLRHMASEDFERHYMHSENGPVSLHRALAMYAWHGDHHLAHVELVVQDGRR